MTSQRTIAALEEKARQWERAKEDAKRKISSQIQAGKSKLNDIERNLLNEVENKFESNPFTNTLTSIYSGTFPLGDEIKKVLGQEIPSDFGPDEESFRFLLKEIEDFGVWENRVNRSCITPRNVRVKMLTVNSITLSWNSVEAGCFYEIEFWALSSEPKTYRSLKPEYTLSNLKPKTEYYIRVRAILLSDGIKSAWSSLVTTHTECNFSESIWGECPDEVDEDKKYFVNEENPRIATKIGNKYYCTAIGRTPLPPRIVTSWSIKVLKSKNNDGNGICIGVSPFDINQSRSNNIVNYGWYLDFYDLTLHSGPPHNYWDKEYGPRKEEGEYVHIGDSVGVIMDTTKGELSFVVNGVNLGVAYEGIPLDKPLVPCVLLRNEGDSIELDTSEVKGDVNNDISVPSRIIAKSITWDSITLKWNPVREVSFYQIEVDGTKYCDVSTTNIFTKRGLLPDTEHSFRVRAVKGKSVGEWSDVVKGRTQKESFERGWWKECPDYVDESRKYAVNEKNPRIVTMIGDYGYWCTIVGNTHFPLNAVTSWSIKVLKSENNDGDNIFIGVAPSDINQNDCNYKKCGWYFYCYSSTLFSCLPHNYRGKEYGPRKEKGEYVHEGESVGVVMDTTKGELSFVVNDVNLGVAYAGIPLDKPLVPCVLLREQDDSIELIISEVEENIVDTSIPVPFNVKAKGITWDSITLTWDAVEDAPFYQIEVDESKLWETSTTNSFIKRGLLPDTEHTFRVRTVRENSVSEWSDFVNELTEKAPFENSTWKDCPENVYSGMRYSVDANNPRIALMNGGNGYCTIIGNAVLLLNKVASWYIKLLKSEENDGNGVCIGVAPFDINQNHPCNANRSGWYLDCYRSALRSGLLHDYKWPGKTYGPRKGDGQYVHTGDIVGVIMDTTKSELSFVLNGVNHGAAYEGILLDKPLVPCILLRNEGDSIELDTSEVKENVDASINISNITSKSNTWDSITLTWDAVEGSSFYQIEVDGSRSWDTSTTSTFTKSEFLEDTEHTFRVRAVKENSVSEWSDVVKGKAESKSFETSGWKECPGDVHESRKYSVDEKNPRIARKNNSTDDYCTIVGNAHLPRNKVVSWSIKILESRYNNGRGIYIGVAPFDINQNEYHNYVKCGWYFGCYLSSLFSGPPHSYGFPNKKYGPVKKGGNGQYIHNGDSISVVMDTAKGKLFFVLNGENNGVAYEGIPLDKPLVPCVLLGIGGDSVEFSIPEKKTTRIDLLKW